MKGLTDERPKAILPVRGKPLLTWALETLKAAGVEETAIVVGYRAETLNRPELRRRYVNPDWETTNMIYSLFQADPYLSESPTLICYSDILFTAATIQKLQSIDGDIAITNNLNWLEVWAKRFADPLVDAETFKRDQRGRLVEIGQKPKSMDEIQGQYMGLLKVTPRGWEKFKQLRAQIGEERFRKIDMTTSLNLLLQSGVEIATADVHEDWYEFDSEEDLGILS